MARLLVQCDHCGHSFLSLFGIRSATRSRIGHITQQCPACGKGASMPSVELNTGELEDGDVIDVRGGAVRILRELVSAPDPLAAAKRAKQELERAVEFEDPDRVGLLRTLRPVLQESRWFTLSPSEKIARLALLIAALDLLINLWGVLGRPPSAEEVRNPPPEVHIHLHDLGAVRDEAPSEESIRGRTVQENVLPGDGGSPNQGENEKPDGAEVDEGVGGVVEEEADDAQEGTDGEP